MNALAILFLAASPIGDGLAAPFRVTDSAGFVDVDGGHAAPLMVDFDSDGLADLLVGQFREGKLRVYKNFGTKKEPKFQGYTWFKAGEQDASIPSG
jgi:hypothetical protein